MHVSEETITPKKARELLDRHLVADHQRKPSPLTVQDYARAMRAGQWMLTHQGIAIDDKGELIDGQQRLMAVEAAGVSVRMLITRGVPSNGSEKHRGMFAIDAVDRGRTRAVGQQLQLRHGWENGNLAASACNTILTLVCHSTGVTAGRSDTGKALQVIASFGSELRFCMENRSTLPGLRIGPVIGSFAFAMRVFPEDVKEAYLRFVSGVDMKRDDPMYALRNFLLKRAGATNGNTYLYTSRAVLQALKRIVTKEPLSRIQSDSEGGYQFFEEKQRPTINKLMVACGYIDRA
jgi:hypothetical protein